MSKYVSPPHAFTQMLKSGVQNCLQDTFEQGRGYRRSNKDHELFGNTAERVSQNRDILGSNELLQNIEKRISAALTKDSRNHQEKQAGRRDTELTIWQRMRCAAAQILGVQWFRFQGLGFRIQDIL